MRICLLATADNPHALRWAKFLISRGHDLLCLCDWPGRGGFLELPPCSVQNPQPNWLEAALCFKLWRHRFGWFFFRARSFREAARRFRPEIVHGMEALNFGYATARCRVGAARVLTPWGLDLQRDAKQSRLARALVSYAVRHVEALTTNAPNLGELVIREYGVAPERVRPFSWGVDRSVFRPERAEEARALRQRWEIPEGARVILSHRQMQAAWGIAEIVEAAGEVAAREPEAFFVFLRGRGDARFEARMRQRAEELGFAGRARWISDLISPEEMAAALNLAEVCVSVPPADLLSISVLEAMACGCLLIATDLPSYRDRLVDGKNALLVPAPASPDALARRILEALRNPRLREEFARRNQRIIAEQDDWDKNATQMEEVYRWALAHPLAEGEWRRGVSGSRRSA